MSHAEKVDAKASEPAKVDVAPVVAPMQVGAADDVAELDADRRADQALGWLAEQRPMDQAAPDTHVHTAACGIGRSHESAGEATIGFEGGALDAGTQREIEGARGGGSPLAPAVREPMEQAFGADLGRVRVHDGADADRISRSISARAFTTGNDIFFARGGYDPGTAQGQRTLAHELGHVMQNRSGGTTVHRDLSSTAKRLKGFFGFGEKTDHEKQVATNRAEMKTDDKAARAEAKQINQKHAEVAAKIKASYTTGPESHSKPPEELKQLTAEFEKYVQMEQAARERVTLEHTGGVAQQDTDMAMVHRLAEAEAQAVWDTASPEVRSMRSLKFDEFDVALREVAQSRMQGRTQHLGAATMKQEKNTADKGAHLSHADAAKQVLEDRKAERVNARGAARAAATGATPAASYGPNAAVAAADGAVETAKKVSGNAGKAGSKIAQQVGKRDLVTDTSEAISAGEVIDSATGSLGSVMDTIRSILTFVQQIDAMKKGTADPGAKVKAASDAAAALKSAADSTKSVLETIKEGIEKFGGATTALGSVSQAIPIVGLITSAIGIVQDSIDLVPLGERLSEGRTTVEQAVLEKKAPLAAAYDRVNSRNAQLVEKKTFSLAKNSTMLGLNIAEVASAGGFAIPAAAKLTVGITDLAHSLGHRVYDAVGEHQSSKAKNAHGVQHQEGAARDVLKYDIGSSVDVIIVAAKTHQLQYAIDTLEGYGVLPSEVTSMWHDELREKVLDLLAAEGDPKTVGEKFDAAKDAVTEALGMEKKPTGIKEEETSAVEKIKSVPAKVGGAFAAVGNYVKSKIDGVKQAHQDAKQLVKSKNDLGHHGRNDRGTASEMFYTLRGSGGNEASYQRVRQEHASRGMADDQLPRTAKDKAKFAEQAARSVVSGPDAGISGPIIVPKKFEEQVKKASQSELYDIINTVNAAARAAKDDKAKATELAKLELIKFEVAARMQTSP